MLKYVHNKYEYHYNFAEQTYYTIKTTLYELVII